MARRLWHVGVLIFKYVDVLAFSLSSDHVFYLGSLLSTGARVKERRIHGVEARNYMSRLPERATFFVSPFDSFRPCIVHSIVRNSLVETLFSLQISVGWRAQEFSGKKADTGRESKELHVPPSGNGDIFCVAI